MATVGAVPTLLALIVLDVADHPIGRWFDTHALTTDALVGVMVLVITVLNVDRIVRRRQVRDRARVTAAQAAIIGRQAQRATTRVRAAIADPSGRDDASDELRTYLTMLLVSAPVLIDARPAREFLEDAQRLGGALSGALGHPERAADPAFTARLDQLADALKESAAPLLAVLGFDQRVAVTAGDDDLAVAGSGAPPSA